MFSKRYFIYHILFHVVYSTLSYDEYDQFISISETEE